MWFRYPVGMTGISVAQNEYGVEATDADGRAYFRAPDHLANVILDLPGFNVVSEPPPGAPPDLPKADLERDTAIERLAKQVDALKQERDELSEKVKLMAIDNAKLRRELNELTKEPETEPEAEADKSDKGKSK